MLSKGQRRSLLEAWERYSATLEPGLDYLERRGIIPEVAEAAGLGVVVDPVKGHERFTGRLAIPYLTDSGPVAFTFRCMGDHDCKELGHPKYSKPHGSENLLFGVRDYRRAGMFIGVTEGEIDQITASLLIGIPSLGCPGADAWRPEYTNILGDFQTVYILSDGDEPGQRFADTIKQHIPHAINMPMPDGMDVNSTYLKYGREPFEGVFK